MIPSALIPLILENTNAVENNFLSQPPLLNQPEPIPQNTPSQYITRPNGFGLYREYRKLSFPLHDPEEEISADDFLDFDSFSLPLSVEKSVPFRGESDRRTDSSELGEFWPYPNKSAFLLGDWYWSGNGQKSKQDFSKLLEIICNNDGFSPADLQNVCWSAIDNALGRSHAVSHKPFKTYHFDDAGWVQDQIKILVPFHKLTGVKGQKEHEVGTFFHRNILDVLKDKVSGPDFKHFHLEPFRLLWKQHSPIDNQHPYGNEAPIQRVYGELYCSEAFLEAHEEIQSAPADPPNCQLPRYVAALMFASDETHLTQFGDTKLWPLYMYFGNESKYRRCQPSSTSSQHLAYFIKVSYFQL
jgi:hypothetical protein